MWWTQNRGWVGLSAQEQRFLSQVSYQLQLDNERRGEGREGRRAHTAYRSRSQTYTRRTSVIRSPFGASRVQFVVLPFKPRFMLPCVKD